jgi:glycerophosphoryl diester phosphodiesterase
VRRMSQVLAAYRGPVAGMSFDPDQVMALRELMPQLTRGIVAERHYTAADWPEASPAQRRGMTHLRHALRSRPHFVAYWVNELPAAAPWIARHIFGLPLLTWTVRTQEQRQRAARYADQTIFEGFVPAS